MPQLLIELFSEEIPARMQAGAARDLERMATERLRAAGLTWDSLTTFAGPRRLTLVVEGLPTATPDREEEVKGPRTSAPDQALDGFLRKTGLGKDQLTDRDGVWMAVIASRGVRTTDVVATMVDQIVRGFPWPKSMRWGSGTLRWVRPLKRIVALFDGHVVPFEIDGIKSDNVTEGHRFMGPGKPFAVRDFADYRHKLRDHHVILDAAERRLHILEAARATCHARGLELVDDDGLLDEVAGLAEWPTPILGDMDPAFLSLPPEVVKLSMKVHQKYFAVRRPGQPGLAPHFLVVANVEASDGGTALVAGNSRVLSARLDDARFFWDEDLKTGFDVWAKKLEGVTFHAKLGTLADRVDRIAARAREIAPLVGADPDQAERAARLSKADLASAMVGEFPELQGVMGGYYARAAGDPDAIADAVRDHYKPQGPADSVPTAPLTVAVALADKLDTLVGFFAIDEKPTGSKDPFALRRATLGFTRSVVESNVSVSLDQLVWNSAASLIRQMAAKPNFLLTERLSAEQTQTLRDEALNRGYGFAEELARSEAVKSIEFDLEKWRLGTASAWLTVDPLPVGREWLMADLEPQLEVSFSRWKALTGTLIPFFADRLKVLLRDQGKRHDLVDAVFALGDDDLVRIVRRVEALDAFLATDDGANLLAGNKRAANILRAEAKKGPLPTGERQTDLAGEPAAETALAQAVIAARAGVDAALAAEDFAAAMTALSRLRGPVDTFFTDVMVNSEIPEERDNRLKLLGQVRDVMGRVADFGLIAG
ncbi:glycine--tRNA ligase subunit beta [uncultured Brevundimonas sp.]|uniref:glycine--tRNA ligase subunit beta n=1 Tax=uncultured Brevundimonas sp. TaxID=213418 RepID=UPI0030EDD81C|tara:strand:+ start:44744 stop:47050 length:2307 start_codon:yes stop_codon:yes gene_type:complete